MHSTTPLARRAHPSIGRLTTLSLFALALAAASGVTSPAEAAITAAGKAPTTKAAKGKQPETLDDFLGLNADSDANRRKAEEQIATCMRKEGFTYIPNPDNGTRVNVRIGGSAPAGEDPRAWKRKHGYGIAESMGSIARPDPSKDPNRAIVDKLSASDRRAYEKALYGSVRLATSGGGGAVISTSDGSDGSGQPQGCMGKAYDGPGAVFDAFRSKIEDAQRRYEADPRIVKANASWSACMRKSGYDVRTPDEVIEKLIMPVQMKLFAAPGSVAPKPGNGPVRVQMVAPSPAKIEEFRKTELTIAKADADCSPATDVWASVRAEYEKAFIDENRDALEKARSAS